jgi:hypothetical protein
MNITHVDSKTRSLGILLVFENDRVRVDSFLVESIGVVHIRKVVKYIESQVNIDLIETTSLLSQLSNFLLFCGGFFCFLKCLSHILFIFRDSRGLKKAVYFFLKLFEVFFFTLVLLIFYSSLTLLGVFCNSFWKWFTFKSCRCI